MERDHPDESETTSPRSTGVRIGRRWVVENGGDCEHRAADSLSIGIGGLYGYEQCRSCGAVFVSALEE